MFIFLEKKKTRREKPRTFCRRSLLHVHVYKYFCYMSKFHNKVDDFIFYPKSTLHVFLVRAMRTVVLMRMFVRLWHFGGAIQTIQVFGQSFSSFTIHKTSNIKQEEKTHILVTRSKVKVNYLHFGCLVLRGSQRLSNILYGIPEKDMVVRI